MSDSRKRRKAHHRTLTVRSGSGHLAVALASLVVAGCVPAPGADNSFYILLPYALAIACTGLSFAWLGKAINGPGPRDRHDASTFAGRLSATLLVGLVACVGGATGELIYLLSHGAGGSFGYAAPGSAQQLASTGVLYAVLFVALLLLAAYALLLLHRNVGQLRAR